MKTIFKCLLGCALMAIMLPSHAQSFVNRISTAEDEYSNCITELDDGGYLISVKRGIFTLQDQARKRHRQIIMKLDPMGNPVDSIVIPNKKPPYISLFDFIKLPGRIITWGHSYNSNFLPTGLYMLTLDDNLNILSDTTYTRTDSYIRTCSCIQNSAGNLIVSGLRHDTLTSQENSFCWEINPDNFTVLNEKYYDQSRTYWVMELPGIEGYFLCAMGYIYRIDYELNDRGPVWESNGLDSLKDHISHKRINDSTYVVSGEFIQPVYPLDRDFAFGVFNKNAQMLSMAIFGKNDTLDQTSTLDFRNPDSIYICGTSNIANSIYESEFYPSDRWMSVFNYKSTGECNWGYYYGGDANYSCRQVIATRDGGCLATGTYYDWRNNPIMEADIMLLKFDNSGGLITGISNPEAKLCSVLVYPNPGNEKLCIKSVLKNLNFELYNANGQTVVSQPVNNGTTTVNTSALPAGMYFYRFMNKDKMVESGKWVKE